MYANCSKVESKKKWRGTFSMAVKDFLTTNLLRSELFYELFAEAFVPIIIFTFHKKKDTEALYKLWQFSW